MTLGLWTRILLVVMVAGGLLVAVQAYAIMKATELTPAVAAGSTALVLGDVLDGGNPGPHFRQRLDRVAAEYRSGRVSRILISGGGTPPEALAGADYLIATGVPPAAIILEIESCSTRSNIRLSASLLRQMGQEGPLVLITNGFHLRRALLIAAEEGLPAVGMPAEVVQPRLFEIWFNVLREAGGIIVRGIWESPQSC